MHFAAAGPSVVVRRVRYVARALSYFRYIHNATMTAERKVTGGTDGRAPKTPPPPTTPPPSPPVAAVTTASVITVARTPERPATFTAGPLNNGSADGVLPERRKAGRVRRDIVGRTTDDDRIRQDADSKKTAAADAAGSTPQDAVGRENWRLAPHHGDRNNSGTTNGCRRAVDGAGG